MRRLLALLALLCVGSCLRFDVFTCSEPGQCDLGGAEGRCEPSGYCSFPDPTCASGFRYSEHAPSSLARQCVDPSQGTGTGSASFPPPSGTSPISQDESSSGDSATPDTSSSSASDSTDGLETTGSLDCVDFDGDGWGAGEDCDGPDCDDDNPQATDDCLYIAPDGDDLNPGTRDDPLRTFGVAVAALSPGNSLVELDGVYLNADSGALLVDCSGVPDNGTPLAPIFVRAQNDRQAILDRGGVDHGIELINCEYWRIRGFAVVGADEPTDTGGQRGDAVELDGSSQIELRHLFVSHSNRYFNEQAMRVEESEDVLLEDVEVHDFFRVGFHIVRSNRVTCRRCYGHSHAASDLPQCPDLATCADPGDPDLVGSMHCPACSSGSPERGDSTFTATQSNDVIFENCVSDGAFRGYSLQAGTGLDGTPAGDDIRVLESISIDDDNGIYIEGDPNPRNLLVEDFVAINPRDIGVHVVHPDGFVLRNVTVLSPRSGVQTRSDSVACSPGTCAWAIEYLLVVDAEVLGVDIADTVVDWTLEWSNVNGDPLTAFSYPELATDAWDDGSGRARFNGNEDPTGVGLADACRVYVPEDSNMADVDGVDQDIGANVADRFVGGASADEPLWGRDGSFPCGADPAQPDQITGEQCPDLAVRVGFGGASCAVPDAGE